MLRNQNRRQPPPQPDPAGDTDGAFQALDHMGNWVRFADTKATILTAGLGVLLTMLVSNATSVYKATQRGSDTDYAVATLIGAAALALLHTLFWLTQAIRPSTQAPGGINRFAWPTLIRTDGSRLSQHAFARPPREEAWAQVVALSQIADRKFRACRRATWGFSTLALVGTICVVIAAALNVSPSA